MPPASQPPTDRDTDRIPAPALRVRGLVKHYGEFAAVNGLDLDLARGEVLALLGPNGAGKTTTIEICEGFTAADDGTVEVLGLDPLADNDSLRTRIGVMLQGGGAYPGAKASEMLRLCAAYADDPLDPDWLLEVLGLTDVADTTFRRLSGGQQQRLSLACALVGRPELVFLDEPTAGMDPHARLLVWELIARLRADGVAVLLTTHLLDEAEELADHILIIDNGRAVASGTPSELTRSSSADLLFLTAPSGLDVAEFTAALPAGYRCTATGPGSYEISGTVSPEAIALVTRWCADHDVLLTQIRVDTASLQDVFLQLTGREVRT